MIIKKVLPQGKALEHLNYLDDRTFFHEGRCPKTGKYWWLATECGVPVGFAGFEVLNQTTAFMCRAGVLHEYRGHGLHKRLIRVRVKAASALGLKQLVTYTHPENLRSANNLLNCGFRLYKPHNPFGMTGALYFKKEIQ